MRIRKCSRPKCGSVVPPIHLVSKVSHNPSPSHGRVYTKFCRSGSNGTNAHRESKSISMGGARSKSYYFVPVQMSVEPGSFA